MVDDRTFWAVAARFVAFVHAETRMPLIVCDARGIIREAVVKSRIGTPHAGAQRILRGEVDDAFVTAEEAEANPNVKEGYNCPVILGGQRVATFGIAGPLGIARPLGRISAAVLASWLDDASRQQQLAASAGTALASMRALSTRVDETAARVEAAAARTGEAGRDAAARMEEVDRSVEAVRDVAQKSRVLAINASVEAARAGASGRSFAVVAKEMIALADQAKEAGVRIAGALSATGEALARIREAMEGSARDGAAQTATTHELLRTAAALQAAVEELSASLSHGGKR